MRRAPGETSIITCVLHSGGPNDDVRIILQTMPRPCFRTKPYAQLCRFSMSRRCGRFQAAQRVIPYPLWPVFKVMGSFRQGTLHRQRVQDQPRSRDTCQITSFITGNFIRRIQHSSIHNYAGSWQCPPPTPRQASTRAVIPTASVCSCCVL